MFMEYWRRPEATEQKFLGDWMLTGDRAHRDRDGYVFFEGRDDDVISSAGYRIGPAEIEDVLLRHPAVANAAAVGKPDALRGEVVKAFIVLKPGFSPSPELAKEIQAQVKTRQHLQMVLAQYPRDRVVRDDLGRTYFLQRRYQDALQEFNATIAIDPEDLEANYNLMLTYTGLGKPDLAAEFLKRYLRFQGRRIGANSCGPMCARIPTTTTNVNQSASTFPSHWWRQSQPHGRMSPSSPIKRRNPTDGLLHEGSLVRRRVRRHGERRSWFR